MLRVHRLAHEVLKTSISVAIQNPLTAADPNGPVNIGVNGVHVRGRYAYWTNYSKGLFARVPIDAKGVANGPAETVLQGSGDPQPDDFTLTQKGDGAYITDATLNAISYFDGTRNSKPIVSVTSPTSVQLGRAEKKGTTIYIGNTGNTTLFNLDPVPTGGSILKYQVH